jgi:hypothetical protein
VVVGEVNAGGVAGQPEGVGRRRTRAPDGVWVTHFDDGTVWHLVLG